ncbi:hypothetical protein M9435_001591 [Picochlorum sp. BPE23]|nr:hypothetical protein M9435_001591 [Picochlorum sp. BPE23]
MWRLALLLVLALSVRAQNDDADRLLTSVRQPVIVEANLPNITAEEEYTCSVVSQGPSGTSAPAGASPVTYSWPSTCPPATPTGVNASQIPDTCTPGIRVEWNEVTTGPPPSQYIVECTGGASPVQKNVSSVETTADLTPVEGNITYSCTVTSKTASGEESAASQPSSVTHSFGPGCCVLSSDCDDAGAFCSQNECISLTFQVQSDYFGLRGNPKPGYSTTRGLRGLGVSYDGSSVYTGYIHSATTAYTQAIRKVSAGVLAVEGSDTAIFGNGMPQGETVDDYFNANREDYPIQDYIKIRWGGYGGQPAYGGPDNSASNCQVWNTTENNDNGGAICTQGPFKAWAGIPIVPGVNQKPVDIKEDDRGNVYVALEDGKRILILTSDLDTVLYTGDPGLAGEPTGLDWWKEGTTYWLYVTTEKESGIARWDVSDPKNPLKDDSWNPGVTSGSEGSAVDADGTVYVAGDDKIRKFSANGTFVMESGEEVTGASELQIFGDKLFIISQSTSVTKQLRVLNKADLGDLVEIAVPFISPPAGTFDPDTNVQERGSAAQFTGLGISPNGHLYLSEEIYVGGSGGIADLYIPPATTFNQNPDVINPDGTGTVIYFDRVLVSSSVCKNCPPCPFCPSLSA